MSRVFTILFVGISAAHAAEPVDFNRDVRSILSNRCFKCHGPDPATREADLRLDTKEGLFSDANGYAAFVPGDPDASEALRRMLSEDDADRMPPPDAKKDLTPREKEIIKAWVAQGATWEPHWAFVAPVRPEPPKTHGGDVRNSIDRFVQAKLETAGLTPAAEADRYTLVRRVYLDLIGLPPTREEADAFVADASPDAYERLVDRLLASPHYGERWARRWLDLARYADTNGYEKDRPREIWPYRDWVVASLNAGMPFDEFTVKQLAGDMLPGATTADLVATGFHRNTMLNEEGGIDPLEFRYHAMADRVATTGTTWLGLTTGCAQCHDHKYDPISHREYFGMMAFLNNADEPELPLPDPALDALYERNLAEADRLLEELPAKWPLGSGWRTASIVAATTESGETPTILDDGSALFAAPGPDRDAYTFVVETEEGSTGRLRIEAVADDRLPNRGPGRVGHGNFVLTEVTITASPRSNPAQARPVALAGATADVAQENFPAQAAIDGQASTGWAVHVPGKSLNVDHALTIDFKQPVAFAGGTRFVATLRQDYGGLHTIGRVRIGVPVSPPASTAEARRELVEAKFTEWLQRERTRTVDWTTLKPTEAKSNLPLLTVEADGTVFASGDTTKQDTYELAFRPETKAITAIRLEALPDVRLPAGGPGMTYYEGPKGDFFLYNISVTADGKPVTIARATNGLAADGSGNAAAAALAIDENLQTGWNGDGRQGERQTAVFVFEKPVSAAELRVTMGLGRYYASSLGKFRISTTTAASPEARDLPEEVETLLAKPEAELTDVDRRRLRTEFLLRAPELAAETKRIRELRERPQSQTTLVFRERPAENPRPTFLRNRGEFLQPKEQVPPVTLEALHDFPAELPRDRLGFARWLVDEENPLAARVAVNREWAAFFGRGIVSTVQDFGFQGEAPSHPELLDWLAVEFMESGWDLKRLHRLIVTSAAYRRASDVTPEALEQDPQNVFLARGPRVRLEAELIRDSALAASGLLVPKLAGPPVKPPQPAGATEIAYGGAKWEADVGQDRYRRSLYTFTKRTAPFAMFSVFDGPSGEACTARRDVSNTALQSLTLLNDEMFLETARALGGDLTASKGTDVDRATDAFRRILTRPPSAEETQRLAEFVTAQRARFENGELDAKAFAGAGDGDVKERAVWTALVRALLSLDETVTRS